MATDNLMPQSSTSIIKHFMLRSSSTGQGLTGKVHSDFSGKYNIAGGAEVTLSFSSGTAGDAYSSGKIVPLGLGKYAWHVPDAVFASLGNVSAVLSVTGGIDVHCEWMVVADDRTLAAKPVNVTKFGGTNGTFSGGIPTAALDSADKATLVDLIWDEPLTGATHNVANSSGKRLRQTTAFQQIDSTVIDASATTTTFVTGLTSSVDNFYNDSMLVFTDGALAGQVRAISDYIGATKTIVLAEALTSAPVNGVAFTIVSLHIHPVSQIQSGLATSAELVTLRGADNDTLKTLSDQIDTVSADVSSIASVSREAF